jgi:hypothetical protein
MKNLIVPLLLLTLILAGCSPSVSIPPSTPIPTVTSTPETVAVSRSGSGSLFAINEVGLGQDGYVSLTNFTGQPASLSGLFLCQGSSCFELPETDVPADSTVRVAIGDGSELENVVATGAAVGGLQSSDGEIGLYASPNITDPDALLAYLQWGSTPHQNTGTAVQAGLWIEGAFAPSSNQAKRLYRTEGGLWLFDEN